MSVNGKNFSPKGKQKNARCSFETYSIKSGQHRNDLVIGHLIEAAQTIPGILLLYFQQQLFDPPALQVLHPTNLDGRSNTGYGSLRHFFPGRVTFAEPEVCAMAVSVVGVLREHRPDQHVERPGPCFLLVRDAENLFKLAEYTGCSPLKSQWGGVP